MHFKLNWKRLSLWLWQPLLNLVHILCRSLSLSVTLCMMMSTVGAEAFLSHVSVPLVYLPWHTTAFPLREALGGSAHSVCTLTLVGKTAADMRGCPLLTPPLLQLPWPSPSLRVKAGHHLYQNWRRTAEGGEEAVLHFIYGQSGLQWSHAQGVLTATYIMAPLLCGTHVD